MLDKRYKGVFYIILSAFFFALMALLVRLDQYAALVTDFIHQHTLDYSYLDCPCGERENESSH